MKLMVCGKGGSGKSTVAWMIDMAWSAGLAIRFVLNKVDERVEAAMERFVDPQTIVARIPYSEEVFLGALKGAKLDARLPEIDDLCKALVSGC